MALEFIPERDELLTCPYDDSHSIRAFRFPRHLVKCGRNRAVKLEMCPFNANHLLPEEERKTHIAHCVDRIIVQRQLDPMKHCNFSGNLDIPNCDNEYIFPATEKLWVSADDTSSRLSYDPSEAMSRARFRNPSCLSTLKPAEKKLFHDGLLRKFRSLSRDDVDDEAVSGVADELLTLRLPRQRRMPSDIDQSPSEASSLPSSFLKEKQAHGRRSPDIEGLLSDLERAPSSVASSYTSSLYGMGRGWKPPNIDGESSDNERPPSVVSSCASTSLGMGRGRQSSDIDGASSDNERLPSSASMFLGMGRGWRPPVIDETSSDIGRSPSVASSYVSTYVGLGRARTEERPRSAASVRSTYYTPVRELGSLDEGRPPSVASVSSSCSYWSVGRKLGSLADDRPPSVVSVSSSFLGMGRGRLPLDDERSTDGSAFEDAPIDAYMLSSRGESLRANFRDKFDSDRDSVRSSSTLGATIEDRQEEVEIVRRQFASLCLQIDPDNYFDSCLVQYIADRLSYIQLDKDSCSCNDSLSYIIEQLSCIRLSVSFPHSESLIQNIIDRLSAIRIGGESPHRNYDFASQHYTD